MLKMYNKMNHVCLFVPSKPTSSKFNCLVPSPNPLTCNEMGNKHVSFHVHVMYIEII